MPLELTLHEQTFFSDASLIGWGAHLGDQELAGVWSDHDRLCHIYVLELKAVRFADEHWGSQYPEGTRWLVFTDNTTVVAHISKQGGTRSLSLCLEAEDLIRLAFFRKHVIRARHIPGVRNVLADALSRPNRVIGTEWSLCPFVFRQICRVFGTPMIDLFATSKNHKLPLFFSPLPESTALDTDAMSQSWEGMYAYAYPPTGFVGEVLHKIARSQCEILLVAPCWPTQAWFPLLLSLLIDHPRVLPLNNRLLRQPGTDVFHDAPQVLRLHVWKLSSSLSDKRVFLDRCRDICPERTVSHQQERTKPSGAYSFVGAKGDVSIHSLPL
jgi:hypothetical protein